MSGPEAKQGRMGGGRETFGRAGGRAQWAKEAETCRSGMGGVRPPTLRCGGAARRPTPSERYKPFGEVRYATTGQTLPTKYTFTGQYSYVSDEATDAAGFGLMYFNARFYDPALGRFSSADTIVPGAGDSQAWDRYAFANNNPVRYTDPSGHSVDCAIGELYCETGQINTTKRSNDLYNSIIRKDVKNQSRTSWEDLTAEERGIFSESGWSANDFDVVDNGVSKADPLHDPAVYVSLLAGGWASGLTKGVGEAAFYTCLRIAACARVVASTAGITVYRVWGGAAGPTGGSPVTNPGSWTPINPLTVADYAYKAGLPSSNTAQYLSVGTIYSMEDVAIVAAAKIGPNAGGLLEYLIANPQIQVLVQEVQYLSK